MKWILIIALFYPTIASAALIDRGGGLIYDDVLNVTWLQNSGGTGYGGSMKGQGILSCLQCFDGSAPELGPTLLWNGIETTGWRLPRRFSDSSSGYTSEIDYMFKSNLGLTGNNVPLGNLVNITTSSGVTIFNISEDVYWMAEQWRTPDGFGFLWSWEIDRAPQLNPLYQDNYGALWFLRDGDIATSTPVPEPGALTLAGAALISMLFAAITRRPRRNAKRITKDIN